jgi:hypothetical protein
MLSCLDQGTLLTFVVTDVTGDMGSANFVAESSTRTILILLSADL